MCISPHYGTGDVLANPACTNYFWDGPMLVEALKADIWCCRCITWIETQMEIECAVPRRLRPKKR